MKGGKNLDLVDPSDITAISAVSSDFMAMRTVSNDSLHTSLTQHNASEFSTYKQGLVDLKDEMIGWQSSPALKLC